MSTPSKLELLRAAGKIQREIALEAQEAEIHAAPADSFVTSRRKAPDAAAVNPIEQISKAQVELEDVSGQLDSDRDLLRHLRRANPDTETEFEEEFADAVDSRDRGGTDDDVGPPPTREKTPFTLPTDSPQFSREWFAGIIGAAVSAAASAAASASPASAPSSSASKLKLSDRKLPDFWEWQPVAWFRLFDRHVAPFKPSQAQKFDALLPLLTTAACKHVQPVRGCAKRLSNVPLMFR